MQDLLIVQQILSYHWPHAFAFVHAVIDQLLCQVEGEEDDHDDDEDHEGKELRRMKGGEEDDKDGVSSSIISLSGRSITKL